MPIIALVALIFVATPRTAAAYIDPSAGSIVLQLVLGGIAGLSVIAKLYYRRLVALVRSRPREATPLHGDPAAPR